MFINNAIVFYHWFYFFLIFYFYFPSETLIKLNGTIFEFYFYDTNADDFFHIVYDTVRYSKIIIECERVKKVFVSEQSFYYSWILAPIRNSLWKYSGKKKIKSNNKYENKKIKNFYNRIIKNLKKRK